MLLNLQAAFGQLVEEDIVTKIDLVSRDDAETLCNRQSQNFDLDVFENKQTEQIRVVTVAGFACPCGGEQIVRICVAARMSYPLTPFLSTPGTHVRSTSHLRANRWGVTGIKCKKGVVRVKYGQQWDDA